MLSGLAGAGQGSLHLPIVQGRVAPGVCGQAGSLSLVFMVGILLQNHQPHPLFLFSFTPHSFSLPLFGQS